MFFDSIDLHSTAAPKLWPAGQNRPAKGSNPARELS